MEATKKKIAKRKKTLTQKVSKTWLAAIKSRGTVVVNDPALLL